MPGPRAVPALLLAHLLLLAGAARADGPPVSQDAERKVKVFGYVESMGGADPRTLDLAACTHVIEAFLLPDSKGSLTPANGLPRRSVIDDAHAAGCKVLVSVGGATVLPSTFLAIASDPATLERFAAGVASFVRSAGYDGVDIDWEFPAQADREPYVALLRAVRSHLDRDGAKDAFGGRPTLVFGITTGNWLAGYDFAALAAVADYGIYYGYDFRNPACGPWANEVELVTQDDGARIEASCRGVLAEVVRRGFPRERLAAGLPFYTSGHRPWVEVRERAMRSSAPLHALYLEKDVEGDWVTDPQAARAKASAAIAMVGGLALYQLGHQAPTSELTDAIELALPPGDRAVIERAAARLAAKRASTPSPGAPSPFPAAPTAGARIPGWIKIAIGAGVIVLGLVAFRLVRGRLPDVTVGPAVHVFIAWGSCLLLLAASVASFVELPLVLGDAGPTRRFAILVAAAIALLFTFFTVMRYVVLMTIAYLGSLLAPPPPSSSSSSSSNQPEEWPAVSILVPAFNEATRIEVALESMRAIDYPRLEVIVIDDGSRDGTFERANRYAGVHGGVTIRVIRKRNGGKASALNLAYRHATSPLVLGVDADSHLAPDSVKLLVRHFADPQTAACCGQVRVRNRTSITERFQALEYALLNGLPRQFQNYFSTVLIAPGPISMFRRSVLEKLEGEKASEEAEGEGRVDGPWQRDTFAEDSDLSMRILVTGGKVKYESRALAFTAAPSWNFPLLNQRYRWVRGTLQATFKAWALFNRTPGAPRALPIWFAYQIIEAVLWPVLNLLGIVVFALLCGNVGLDLTMAAWIGFILGTDLNAAAFSLKVERDDRRLLLATPLLRLYYNVLLDVGRLIAVFDELRRRRMTWS